jgi:Zn-dependent protease/predicted transcriptional regulator
MQGSFKLGTLAGIDIRLHYTWLLAFFLIAWSLALGYFPMAGDQGGPITAAILGAVAALLLFVSVLLHELGHSLVARALGLRVDNITLFIFGGVSNITREPSSARDEFLISVVGPLVSLVLAGLFWSIGLLLPSGSTASALVAYLASTNLLLGLFNIVPGFPLDGGRVLRSIVWAVTGDMARATRSASYVGQAVAFVLIGWGVLRSLTGDVGGGIWIAFIGWFLNSGAEAARQELHLEQSLAQVPVTSIMDRSLDHVSSELTVSDFVVDHVSRGGRRAMPVLDSGQLVGIMSVTDAKHVDQPAWPTTRIAEVMTRASLHTLGPEANLADALQLMVDHGVHQVPIVQGGALVGMVTRADVMRYMQSASGLAGNQHHLGDDSEVCRDIQSHLTQGRSR